jgi:hypothetical protein
MRHEPELSDLERMALRRLSVLRALALASAHRSWRERDQAMAFVAIEALNTWHQYCRHYFLSCALGTIDRGGTAITNTSAPAFRTESDAIKWAQTQVPKKHLYLGEPRWRTPTVWTRVMRRMGSSASAKADLAAGIATSVFVDLPRFRNFYAHRCRDTAIKARAMSRRKSIGTTGHPTDMLLATPAKASVPLVVDWLDDLYAAVDLTN